MSVCEYSDVRFLFSSLKPLEASGKADLMSLRETVGKTLSQRLSRGSDTHILYLDNALQITLLFDHHMRDTINAWNQSIVRCSLVGLVGLINTAALTYARSSSPRYLYLAALVGAAALAFWGFGQSYLIQQEKDAYKHDCRFTVQQLAEKRAAILAAPDSDQPFKDVPVPSQFITEPESRTLFHEKLQLWTQKLKGLLSSDKVEETAEFLFNNPTPLSGAVVARYRDSIPEASVQFHLILNTVQFHLILRKYKHLSADDRKCIDIIIPLRDQAVDLFKRSFPRELT